MSWWVFRYEPIRIKTGFGKCAGFSKFETAAQLLRYVGIRSTIGESEINELGISRLSNVGNKKLWNIFSFLNLMLVTQQGLR